MAMRPIRPYAANLVQIGENVREKPAFMRNCCGCCCETLLAARRFAPMQPVATTNYIPRVEVETCIGCGKCEKVCPVLAVSMAEIQDTDGSRVQDTNESREQDTRRKTVVVDKEICLGCGICVRNCPVKAITLEKRPVQIITPVNSTHRFVLQAIEKGTLQNLIFDNGAFADHRAMAAVFAAILKLPLLTQALASKQFKSIYLDKLISRGLERV